MPRPIREFFGFMHFLVQRFDEDRCIQIASSLTYTTLLSLVPLMVIAFTVISAFPVFSGLMVQLKIFLLTNMVPEVAGKIITVYMQEFSEKAARLTAAGIAALAVTALILMQTIEHAFNVIWRVTTRRRLLQRVLTYWAVLTLGPLLLGASLSLTSYLVSYSLGYVEFVPSLGVGVLKVVPLVITSLAFSLLYFAVPNRYVPFHHALAGGVVAGLGLGLMSKGFAAYILHFSGYTLVYGAFASLPIFLLWVYLSWLVVVSGAVLAASLPYWQGGMWQVERTAGRRYFDALSVLQALCHAQRRGEVLNLAALQRETRVTLEELENILLQLLDARWVARTAGQRWLLSAHPSDIPVREVFHRFVFKPEDDLPAESNEKLAALSWRTAASLDLALVGSLEDLCAMPESA